MGLPVSSVPGPPPGMASESLRIDLRCPKCSTLLYCHGDVELPQLQALAALESMTPDQRAAVDVIAKVEFEAGRKSARWLMMGLDVAVVLSVSSFIGAAALFVALLLATLP